MDKESGENKITLKEERKVDKELIDEILRDIGLEHIDDYNEKDK